MKTADASLVSMFCKREDNSSSSSNESDSEDLGDVSDSEVPLIALALGFSHFRYYGHVVLTV